MELTMKSLILSALVLSAPAFADTGILCHSQFVADDGYSLQVNESQTQAVLGKISKRGTAKLADLECTRSPEICPNGNADQIVEFMVCSEKPAHLGSYVVRLSTGGFAGLTTASVRKVFIATQGFVEVEQKFGKLGCQETID